jgi:hypothetical protein
MYKDDGNSFLLLTLPRDANYFTNYFASYFANSSSWKKTQLAGPQVHLRSLLYMLSSLVVCLSH